MSDIDQIKSKIAITESKIAITEAELAEAKRVGDKNEVKELRALLIEQQKEKNLLLASQGKFQLLSLHIDRSNPILPHL